MTHASAPQPQDAHATARQDRRPVRQWILQGLGFLVGVGLLGWCLTVAFSQQNRAKLEQLREADATQIALLIGLGLVMLGLDAGIFWLILRPVRTISFIGVQATNAVATFLGLLPFKLGMIFRIAAHHRRDGVPLPLIAAWFTSFGGLMFAGLVPLLVASLVAKRVNTLWFVLAIGVLVGWCVLVLVVCRWLQGEAGVARLQAMTRWIPPLSRLLQTKLWRQLHSAFDIQSYPSVVFGAVTLRLLFIAAQAGQFFVASRILQQPLSAEQSLLFASVYYLVGAASPTGQLGTREAAIAGFAASLNLGEPGTLVTVPLVVTAASILGQIPAAIIGLLILQPQRWFVRQATHTMDATTPDEKVGPSATATVVP
jgi:Lysylphosphatidylglycerol synthase TM region